jgi:hypothetical protein
MAFTEPAVVQSKGVWTADIRYSQPKQISVKVPSSLSSKPQRYWYIILSITNNTNQDIPFFPAFYLVTDTFKIIPSEKRMRKVVFDKIKRLHQGTYPFLESLDFVGNKILQGQDNTRDICVIWPDFDPKAKNVDMYFSGLSNEIAVIDHPIKKASGGKPKKVYLSKTLQLKYAIGGDERLRAYAKLTPKTPIHRKWVMR